MHDPALRYLQSKRTVDDRALNRHVLEVLRRRWPSGEHPTLLEIGGGLGTMLERLLAWGFFAPRASTAEYTILDIDPNGLAEVRRRFPERQTERPVRVRTVERELEAWLDDTEASDERFDVILANAVLDLVDLERVLPRLLARLREHGTFWFTINFDGDTIFVPAHESDGTILAAYHGSMGALRHEGRPHGDAYTGRRLFEEIPRARGRVLAAGSSDWVVFPHGGRYPDDEAYFLHHILHTIDRELAPRPALAHVLPAWLEARHAQIEAGELVYIAHQIDFVGAAEPR